MLRLWLVAPANHKERTTSDTTFPEDNRNRNYDHDPEPVDYAHHEEQTGAPDYTGTGSHSAPADSGDTGEG